MPTLMKYFALAAAGKDITEAYEAEKGNPKPVFLKKRVIGAVAVLGSTGIGAFLGYEIDKAMLVQFIDILNETIANVYQIYELINVKIIPALGVLYGIIIYVKGEIDKSMRVKNGKTNGQIQPSSPSQ